jgi:hypothetical protein
LHFLQLCISRMFQNKASTTTLMEIYRHAFRYSVSHTLSRLEMSHCICCMSQVRRCRRDLRGCAVPMMMVTEALSKPWKMSNKRLSQSPCRQCFLRFPGIYTRQLSIFLLFAVKKYQQSSPSQTKNKVADLCTVHRQDSYDYIFPCPNVPITSYVLEALGFIWLLFPTIVFLPSLDPP